jgi:hypothetical protein
MFIPSRDTLDQNQSDGFLEKSQSSFRTTVDSSFVWLTDKLDIWPARRQTSVDAISGIIRKFIFRGSLDFITVRRLLFLANRETSYSIRFNMPKIERN